jgi:hypothetical protein
VGQLPLQSAASRINNSIVNTASDPTQIVSQSTLSTQHSFITQPAFIDPLSSFLISQAIPNPTPPTLSYLQDHIKGSLLPIIKWIPWAARQHCASLLAKHSFFKGTST